MPIMKLIFYRGRHNGIGDTLSFGQPKCYLVGLRLPKD